MAAKSFIRSMIRPGGTRSRIQREAIKTRGLNAFRWNRDEPSQARISGPRSEWQLWVSTGISRGEHNRSASPRAADARGDVGRNLCRANRADLAVRQPFPVYP